MEIKEKADALEFKAKDIYLADSKKLEASILAVEHTIGVLIGVKNSRMDNGKPLSIEIETEIAEQTELLSELKSRL